MLSHLKLVVFGGRLGFFFLFWGWVVLGFFHLFRMLQRPPANRGGGGGGGGRGAVARQRRGGAEPRCCAPKLAPWREEPSRTFSAGA